MTKEKIRNYLNHNVPDGSKGYAETAYRDGYEAGYDDESKYGIMLFVIGIVAGLVLLSLLMYA